MPSNRIAGVDHEAGHHHRGDRVGAFEPGRDDHDARDQRPDQRVEVGEDVPEARLDVQAAAICVGELAGDGEVDRDTGKGDGDDRTALHRQGRRKPEHRLEHEHRREHEQGRAADQRGKHLGALEAEGEATLRGPLGEAERDQRDAERRDIGEHVRRVGEQGEGPRQDRDHHLDRDEDADQAERGDQRSLVRVARNAVRVRRVGPVVVHHLTLLRSFRRHVPPHGDHGLDGRPHRPERAVVNQALAERLSDLGIPGRVEAEAAADPRDGVLPPREAAGAARRDLGVPARRQGRGRGARRRRRSRRVEPGEAAREIATTGRPSTRSDAGW